MKPRTLWFKERVAEVVRELYILEKQENWDEYRRQAFELSKELHYATVEWEKYYNEG